MKKPANKRFGAALSLLLAVCLLLSACPAALAATQVGSAPGSLSASAEKKYIQLSRSVPFFTGDTYGTGAQISPVAGTVCQLYTDDWYAAADGLNYFSVYYLNKRYNVLRSDVVGDIMTAAQLETYITGTLWKQTAYATLRQRDGLVGDVRVHAVQLALQRLGYYTGKLDGVYGEGTAQAVKKFQRAKGLDPDGSSGPLTQPTLFALASGSAATTPSVSTGSSATTGSTVAIGSTAPATGTLQTTASVNLRQGASTSSQRLAVIPRGIKLSYTGSTVQSGVTWFRVTYNELDGWIMGTFASASGTTTSPAIGTVTITKPGTRVRDAADGKKTGTVLAKGTVVDLLAQPVSANNYSWYNIRTSSGLVGFVRGDCVSVNTGASSGTGSAGGTASSGGSLTLAADQAFVRLPANTKLFQTEGVPATGYQTVSAGTVLMLSSNTTYTYGGAQYASVYFNNEKYNVLYADVKDGMMSTVDVTSYCNTLLQGALSSSLKKQLGLVGDVRVYALQAALKTLGYYTGKLDGTYGAETYTAVRNFQRAAKVEVDGACGAVTWKALNAKLNGAPVSGGTGSTTPSTGTPVTVADFGTVTSVQKISWDYDDNGANLFPKSSYATVMDVTTGKVFQVYRWSGGSHADCVPASSADTRTMCEIVGFPYNSSHPNSTQLDKIKADGNASVVTYTWPDFKNAFGGAKNIGSAWDRRPALLNVGGKVYCVSIYGFPHGFTGTDGFSKSKFPNGQYFYAANNYYGMLCVHFVGSKTHGGSSPDAQHQAAIEKAYQYAKSLWPTLCK